MADGRIEQGVPTSAILGEHIQVWLNFTDTEGPAWIEGTVVGYYDHPTILIETAGGEIRAVSSRLRRRIAPTELGWFRRVVDAVHNMIARK